MDKRGLERPSAQSARIENYGNVAPSYDFEPQEFFLDHVLKVTEIV